MNTEQINISVQAQTSDAQSNVSNLDNSISNLIKSISQLNESMIKNVDSSSNLTKGMGELDKSVTSNTKTMSSLKSGLNDLVPAFGGAINGSIALGESLWELAANPLVAIFIAIVAVAELVFKAFTDNVGASDKLGQMWAGLSLVMTTLKEAAYALVRGLVDLYQAAFDFFTFDFKGASEKFKQAQEEGKNAVDKTTEALGDQYDAMKKITAAQQENDRVKEAFVNTEKSLQAQLAKSKEILSDTTATIAQKTKALKESEDLERQISGTKTKLAKQDFDLQSQRLELLGIEAKDQEQINKLLQNPNRAKLTEDQVKELEKLNKLNGIVIDTTTEQAHTELNLNKQRKRLNSEIQADAKKSDEERKKKIEERKKARQKELKDIKDTDELAVLNAKEGTQELLTAQEKEIDDEKKYYKKHWMELGLSKAEFDLKMAELDKKKDEERKKARQKELKDIKEANEIKKKADQDDIKSITDQEDVLNKEVGFSKEKADKLILLAKQEHDAKLKLLTDEYEATLAIMKAKGEDTTALTAKYNNDILKNDSDTTNKQKKIGEDLADSRIKTYDLIGNAATSLTNLMGKNTEIGKGIAIAQATIDTYGAATKALNAKYSPEGTTDMVLRIAAVTTTIANGLSSIKAISSAKTGEGGGSSTSTPSTPSVQFTAPQMFGVGGGQISNPAQYAQNKVYVTESDITKTQDRVKTIENSAILGH
jgi:hypothetical protein